MDNIILFLIHATVILAVFGILAFIQEKLHNHYYQNSE